MTVEARLASLFEELERDRGFSGAVLVSQERRTLFEGAYGFASRQLSVPNALATRFHIASLTKMFIAMAALMLVEDGRIVLDERPARYLPELLSLDERITLHHLLSHTSGLRDVYEIPNKSFEARKARNSGMDLLAYLAGQPLTFAPGERWAYSSTGYLLVGYVLEQVVGTTFETLMRDLVLAPLGMTDTGIDRPHRVNPGRAYGHTIVDGQPGNAGNDALSAFRDGPAELYSTVGDLKLWCDAMFDCPLVSADTLALMFTPHATIGGERSYGYGWFLEPSVRFHGGGTPGFISRIRQVPEQELSLIVVLNSNHVDPDPILAQMGALLADT
jgi:CubicO group peptidase (beta-lactamase class C family)